MTRTLWTRCAGSRTAADERGDSTSYEITAAMVLLKGLPLDGAIITGDAIFCQREICRHIRDANGHYVFVVKDNQPALKAAIAESFGDFSPCRDRPGKSRSAA